MAIQLLDAFGRPVETSRLTAEEATPTLSGVRSILGDHPTRGLTPSRLVQILTEAEEGDARRYLEVAEEMEEKDLHYLSVLQTRKNAVCRLPLLVEAATDDAEDVKIADAVRAMLARDDISDDIFDVLDAIGKGLSVTEIMWETSATEWRPTRFEWRDPRWFLFDRTDGRTLRLRDGSAYGAELAPFKYIRHISKAKSGLAVRGGLGRAIAWAYLFKNFGLKGWLALAEVYGIPWRLGKYEPGATTEEKATLLRAVSNMASDAAAIIPRSMMIEVIESAQGAKSDIHASLLDYIDRQVSKAVLGQTLTSDVSKDGGSRALGDVHNDVRADIRKADAVRLAATLNRDLVRPYVDLNFGPRAQYPRLRIGLPDELSTLQKIDAVQKLTPYGLTIEQSQIRDLLGFTEPADDAEILRPAPTTPAAAQARRAAHSVTADGVEAGDAITGLATTLADDWQPVLDPLREDLDRAMDGAEDLAAFQRALPALIGEQDMAVFRTKLEHAFATARIAGRGGVDPSTGNASGVVD